MLRSARPELGSATAQIISLLRLGDVAKCWTRSPEVGSPGVLTGTFSESTSFAASCLGIGQRIAMHHNRGEYYGKCLGRIDGQKRS